MPNEMKAIDLSYLLRPYEDKWVALTSDQKKVVGSGKTFKEAEKEANLKGHKKSIFLKVPRFDVDYVPGFL